jgi:hypothetical protein
VPNLTGDPNQPVNVTIRALEPTDQAIPDLWNVPFQQLLNNDANLNQRVATLESNQGGTTLSAHRNASVLDHPDGSVTTTKLADGAVTLAKLATAILGQPNGLPLLNSAGALAASDGYLGRGSLTTALNWNTITNAGVYGVSAGAFGTGSANTPPTTAQTGVLIVNRAGSNVQQMYIPYSEPYTYWRLYNDTGWTSWMASGVLYDSNSNGFYIRFADGTQICWASHSDSSFGSVLTGEDANYKYRQKIWIFPTAFTATPVVQVSGDVVGARVEVLNAYAATTTQCTLEVGQYNTSAVTVSTCYAFAIGRWK